jgi:dienelactone hydrolase
VRIEFFYHLPVPLVKNFFQQMASAMPVTFVSEGQIQCENQLLMTTFRPLFAFAVFMAPVYAQTEADYLRPILADEILPPQVAVFQLRQYILRRVAKPPAPSSAQQWTDASARLRQHLLTDVVFHGWPREWVEAPPKFAEAGIINGDGYRIRKLRYEIVPGFQSVALLYEPDNLHGKVPAILNVNGHVGPPGKTIEYKQKRCITLARHGILALNLEWLSYGELDRKGGQHDFGHHLDLAGANGVGLFYLAMRKGLDYLYYHPNADRSRVGMTGLSGGGWQTIVLSSLDERVKATNPVAGFSSISSRVEAKEYGDLGDFEQSATDMFDGVDFTHLTALMAPRPTLLTYNAEDDCCFRAAMTKPFVFDAIQPIFALYGKQDLLNWHENRDPGTHNYQLDNRTHAYRFFSSQFKLPAFEEEAGVASEIKTFDELRVGLPENNLTILDLARKMAGPISRSPLASEPAGRQAERNQIRDVIRYRPVTIERVWTTAISKHLGIESKSHLISLDNGLSATAVWFKPIGASNNVPATIILDDKGKAASAANIADRLNRGEQVLAIDLPFIGEAWKGDATSELLQLVSGTGARPLGEETAALVQIVSWVEDQAHAQKVRIESSGMRSQVVSMIALALQPQMFSELAIRNGIESLAYVLQKPVEYGEAPELFCLDLLRVTDLDRLAALSSPVRALRATAP